mgnify:CR=1 FL=1
MTDARKDFCSRCGFNVEIFHTGRVARKPPFKGYSEVKYCSPCYDVVSRGQTVVEAAVASLSPPEPSGAAPKTVASSTPEKEVVLVKLRTKLGWIALGLVAGFGAGFGVAILLFIRA